MGKNNAQTNINWSNSSSNSSVQSSTPLIRWKIRILFVSASCLTNLKKIANTRSFVFFFTHFFKFPFFHCLSGFRKCKRKSCTVIALPCHRSAPNHLSRLFILECLVYKSNVTILVYFLFDIYPLVRTPGKR